MESIDEKNIFISFPFILNSYIVLYKRTAVDDFKCVVCGLPWTDNYRRWQFTDIYYSLLKFEWIYLLTKQENRKYKYESITLWEIRTQLFGRIQRGKRKIITIKRKRIKFYEKSFSV